MLVNINHILFGHFHRIDITGWAFEQEESSSPDHNYGPEEDENLDNGSGEDENIPPPNAHALLGSPLTLDYDDPMEQTVGPETAPGGSLPPAPSSGDMDEDEDLFWASELKKLEQSDKASLESGKAADLKDAAPSL